MVCGDRGGGLPGVGVGRERGACADKGNDGRAPACGCVGGCMRGVQMVGARRL